jgi:hypothetical protein
MAGLAIFGVVLRRAPFLEPLLQSRELKKIRSIRWLALNWDFEGCIPMQERSLMITYMHALT